MRETLLPPQPEKKGFWRKLIHYLQEWGDILPDLVLWIQNRRNKVKDVFKR